MKPKSIVLRTFCCEPCPHYKHWSGCECRQGEHCSYVCAATEEPFYIGNIYKIGIPNKCPFLKKELILPRSMVCSSCGETLKEEPEWCKNGSRCEICKIEQELKELESQESKKEELKRKLFILRNNLDDEKS